MTLENCGGVICNCIPHEIDYADRSSEAFGGLLALFTTINVHPNSVHNKYCSSSIIHSKYYS